MVGESCFEKAVGLIGNANNVLVTSHVRPDGDACGAVSAICEALAACGKKGQAVLLSEVPQWYEFLFAERPVVVGERIEAGQFGEVDLIIIVDTNSYVQLPKFDEYLKRSSAPVLVIDHHVTSDGLGDVELIDTSAAASSLIVFDLFKYAGWQITESVARSLFVAIATDTGWFHFSNTDGRAFCACSELIGAGAEDTVVESTTWGVTKASFGAW